MHTARDCDERCTCCQRCYVHLGVDVCDRLCPHAAEQIVIAREPTCDIMMVEGEPR